MPFEPDDNSTTIASCVHIDHDAHLDKLIVHTQTRMMPVFVRFKEQGNLLLPLDSVDEGKVADWIEETTSGISRHVSAKRGSSD